MMVRQREGRIESLSSRTACCEHFVSHTTQDSLIGNVYLGKVQNAKSMEAAFVDIGRNRSAVLYAGEVNWDAAGLDDQPRKIENALKPATRAGVTRTRSARRPAHPKLAAGPLPVYVPWAR